MNKKVKQEWKGYLNYSLTSQDKKDIKKSAKDADYYLSWLDKMIEGGLSASAQIDAKSSSMRLTLTGRSSMTVLDGWSVSAWGQELLQCLAILHYLFASGKYGENLLGLIPMEDDDWW